MLAHFYFPGLVAGSLFTSDRLILNILHIASGDRVESTSPGSPVVCSTWNMVGSLESAWVAITSVHSDPKSAQQLIKLIQRGVMENQPPAPLLGGTAELSPQAKLSGDRLLQVREMCRRASESFVDLVEGGGLSRRPVVQDCGLRGID